MNQGTYSGPVGRSTKSLETMENPSLFRVGSWIVRVRPALINLGWDAFFSLLDLKILESDFTSGMLPARL